MSFSEFISSPALPGVGAILQGCGALFVAYAALRGCGWYAQDVHHKKTEWLYKLFVDFYDDETYVRIRQVLEYKEHRAELDDLRTAVESERTPKPLVSLADDFCDYLNFFEFMCNLVEKRRMDRDDLIRLFDFYLDNLASHDFIMDYLSVPKHGFEALNRHLRRSHHDKIPKGH